MFLIGQRSQGQPPRARPPGSPGEGGQDTHATSPAEGILCQGPRPDRPLPSAPCPRGLRTGQGGGTAGPGARGGRALSPRRLAAGWARRDMPQVDSGLGGCPGAKPERQADSSAWPGGQHRARSRSPAAPGRRGLHGPPSLHRPSLARPGGPLPTGPDPGEGVRESRRRGAGTGAPKPQQSRASPPPWGVLARTFLPAEATAGARARAGRGGAHRRTGSRPAPR